MLRDILYFGVTRNVECESGDSGGVWELFGKGLELLEVPTTDSEGEFVASGV